MEKAAVRMTSKSLLKRLSVCQLMSFAVRKNGDEKVVNYSLTIIMQY